MPTGLAYLGVILVWATTPLTIKWSGEGGSPLGSLLLRMALAAALAWLLLRVSGGRLRWQRRALLGYLAAVPGVSLALALAYTAAPHVPSGLISVMYGLAPLLSGVMLQVVPDAPRLRSRQWLACLLGLAGLLLIFGDGLSASDTHLVAVLHLLGAVLLFSFSGIAVQQVGSGEPPLQQTLGTLLLSLPLFALLWLGSDEPARMTFSRRGAMAVVYLAVFGSVVGLLCYFVILDRLSAATVALVTLITPVLALTLGLLLDGEQPSPSLLGGAALIVAGLGCWLLRGRRAAAEPA